jgi:hypothetical protein
VNLGSEIGRPAGSSGKHRRRHRHRHRSRSGLGAAVRPYGAAIIALLILGVGGVATWYAAQFFLHTHTKRESLPNTAEVGNSGPQAPRWDQDVLDSFEDAAQQAKAGNVTGAEVQVDEAVAEMEEARVRSKAVTSDFFHGASSELDGILKAQPASESAAKANSTGTSQQAQAAAADPEALRLFQHVIQARVELAAVRSWQEPVPADADLAVNVAEAFEQHAANSAAANSSGAMPDMTSASAVSANGSLRLPAGHVDVEAPRNLSKNEVLDPTSLHAHFLDASLMPDTSEILLPPEDRQLSDNVSVESLTIAGASQTLDGIHWRNVTFIETRLRYEDGPLELQNVHFIHCTFGVPSDARGAAIANMIALGNSSLAIQ